MRDVMFVFRIKTKRVWASELRSMFMSCWWEKTSKWCSYLSLVARRILCWKLVTLLQVSFITVHPYTMSLFINKANSNDCCPFCSPQTMGLGCGAWPVWSNQRNCVQYKWVVRLHKLHLFPCVLFYFLLYQKNKSTFLFCFFVVARRREPSKHVDCDGCDLNNDKK